MHGEVTGFMDIGLVNTLVIHHADGISYCVLADVISQQIAVSSADLLGVIQFRVEIIVRQNNGSCYYRTSQTSSAGFVTTADYRFSGEI
jgi:hypothetical protein